MIKPILHFFKIHGEMVLGHSPVVVQDVLGVAPKAFNAVDVVAAAVRKRLAMVQTVVLTMTLERIVAAKRVRVIHRAFPGMGADVCHQLVRRHLLHDLGVNASIALQKAKDNAFAGRPSAALAFASATEAGFVNLNLALQFARFQLGYVVDGLAQALIHPGHRLVVESQISGHAVRRLLLVKPGDDGHLASQLLERLLALAFPALHAAALGFARLERAAKDALPTPQKVGRTVENVLLPHNLEKILLSPGYESH